jgi:hypothetical protein
MADDEAINSKPPHDPDLRGVEAALLHAAQRARERARMTGTRLVFSQNGVLRFVALDRLSASDGTPPKGLWNVANHPQESDAEPTALICNLRRRS